MRIVNWKADDRMVHLSLAAVGAPKSPAAQSGAGGHGGGTVPHRAAQDGGPTQVAEHLWLRATETTMQLFRNHELVTEGYATDWPVEHVRAAAQRIAGRIDELMGMPGIGPGRTRSAPP